MRKSRPRAHSRTDPPTVPSLPRPIFIHFAPLSSLFHVYTPKDTSCFLHCQHGSIIPNVCIEIGYIKVHNYVTRPIDLVMYISKWCLCSSTIEDDGGHLSYWPTSCLTVLKLNLTLTQQMHIIGTIGKQWGPCRSPFCTHSIEWLHLLRASSAAITPRINGTIATAMLYAVPPSSSSTPKQTDRRPFQNDQRTT